MMGYDEHLLITRPAEGTPDGLGGTAHGDPVTVLDTAADVQDGGATARTENGLTITREGDATAFAPSGVTVTSCRVGDDALITWADGTQRTATVKRVARLDEKLILAYA